MNKLNKKGVGLVMSIMIITILLIMASGFFIVTTYMTKTTQSELEKVRLYWAAESGSNYSVNWWVNQDVLTRIAWPYYFDPEANEDLTYTDFTGGLGMFVEILSGSGGMGGNGNSGNNDDDDDDDDDDDGDGDDDGDDDGNGNNGDDEDYEDWDYDLTEGTDAAGTTGDNDWKTNQPSDYHDTNGYLADMQDFYKLGSLPVVCNGIAKDNKLYLHPSSEIITLRYPDSDDTYTLYLLRYKGERIDNTDTAVWVMDTWAVDNATGDTHRVLMSNLFNFTPTNSEWLQYNEGIVHTQWSSTNGRKGVYKNYDYRFGQTYFAEQVRFDYKSGRDKSGPHFYGRIESSSDEQSSYGMSVGNPTLVPLSAGVEWKYGIFAEGKFRSVSDAVTQINASVLGGWDHVNALDADNIVWDWPTVEENSSLTPNGIYMLSAPKYPYGSEIDIELRTNDLDGDGELETWADISIGRSLIETVSVSDGGITGIAIPTEYSDVSIFGNSSDSFSLMTEEDMVSVTDDFYLAELEGVRAIYDRYYEGELDEPTMEMMATLYEAMYDKDDDGNLLATSHLSILSGIALSDMDAEDLSGIPALGNRENQIDLSSLSHGTGLLFTTCGYYLGYGDLGTPSSQRSDLRLYNIGSFILNTQVETTGSNSFKGTIAFVQDKRFYDEDFEAGVGWGSGPGNDEAPITGLNNKYRWTGGYVGNGLITEEDFYDIMQ
ncbi:MAG: hypothetical protein PF574_09755 [Candidatus Delongbacteria bacterium]|jgi:hypothetical protein|nr:hypothetical protein [Candidatus Delongbacteria bacterium]